jgi:prepilin-type N-terminal cleavage/methylation domain-containing protein
MNTLTKFRLGAVSPHRRQHAFTLAELMVVVAVIALLLSIGVAVGRSVYAHARKTLCKNNLHQLGAIFHSDDRVWSGNVAAGTRAEGEILTASRWMNHIYQQHDRSMNALLRCPNGEENDPLDTLDLLWIRQVGNQGSANAGEFHTSIGALLRGSPGNYDEKLVTDWQVAAYYQGTVHTTGLAVTAADFLGVNGGKEPEPNEILLFVDTCATLKITMDLEAGSFTAEPMMGRNVGMSGSHHWLLYGDGDMESWTDSVVVQLTGYNNYTVHEPRDVGVLPRDYGMNTLVYGRHNRYEQLWMTEYNSEFLNAKVFDRDDPFDGEDDNGEFRVRHEGKMNYLTVGGAVMEMTGEEMAAQFELIDEDPYSLFAPGD